jgi:hypothetical protein
MTEKERDDRRDQRRRMTDESTTEPTPVRQCATCPWKVTTVPERDIPDGYCVDLHEALSCTIRSGLDALFGPHRRGMACHYSKIGEEFPCAGWLHHQLGPGNNIGVRLAVATGQLPVPKVEGDQHESFEDTLPKKKPSKKKLPARRKRAKC